MDFVVRKKALVVRVSFCIFNRSTLNFDARGILNVGRALSIESDVIFRSISGNRRGGMRHLDEAARPGERRAARRALAHL